MRPSCTSTVPKDVTDLRRKFGGEVAGVKAANVVDAAYALQQLIVVMVHVVAKAGSNAPAVTTKASRLLIKRKGSA
jgi:hypothetical protein